MAKSVFTQKYERFRELLVEARQDKNLTQAQLAGKLKKPQSFVSKYELGERRLDLIEFLEVARALGINPCDFLQELEKSSKRRLG